VKGTDGPRAKRRVLVLSRALRIGQRTPAHAEHLRPSPLPWVLEIAIIHPERKFGAFYEDLLLENQSFD